MNTNQSSERALFPFPGARVLPFTAQEANRVESHDSPALHDHRKLAFLNYISGFNSRTARNHLVAVIGEFVGTFMFLFFAFSATQVDNTTTNANDVADTAASAPNTSNLLYVALAFGFSLSVNAWVFFRVTGGLFNPAVTFGMMLIGAIPYFRGLLVVVSQIIGAIASAGAVSALFPGPLGVRVSLSPGTSIVRGLFTEMFLTAELVFTIFMLAAEKHKATYIAPVGIGLALFIGELSGVYFTGGAVNPARAFGPSAITGDFPGYHWIYWLGPLMGSLVAVAFYKLVKGLEYETVNPGQDLDTDDETARKKAELEAEIKTAADAADVVDVRGGSTGGPESRVTSSAGALSLGVVMKDSPAGVGDRDEAVVQPAGLSAQQGDNVGVQGPFAGFNGHVRDIGGTSAPSIQRVYDAEAARRL